MDLPPPPAPEKPEQVPPDRELVLRAQQGDPEGFDQLLLRYQKRVYSVIYNMVLNHDDTNDLLMEAFEKAYRSIGNFKADSGFYTWIYRIAVNTALNFLKRHRRYQHVSIDNEDEDLQNRSEFLETKDLEHREHAAQMVELQNKLNESLMKLSDEHRAVVTLFDVQGLSHAEIAQIMKCSEGTVRSRLFYAHKSLQKYLKNFAP
jgi:RNA polymerase sigma-70 factor (ECF subfamily)